MSLQFSAAAPLAPLGGLGARWKLRRCAELGAAPAVEGRVWIHGPGKLVVGDRVRLDGGRDPIELYVGPGAELRLGDGVLIEGGTSIEALQSVRIGDGCRIGAFCKVMDSHFHSAAGDREAAAPAAPVTIEAGATLESRVIVLPGGRVAAGKTIAPGAVVRGRAGAPTAPAEPRAEAPAASRLERALARLRREPLAALKFEIARLRAAYWLSDCERGARVYSFGAVRVNNDGAIRLGGRVGFRGGMIATELICHKGAEIRIGAKSYFNYGAFVEARRSVIIGERCMIASMTRIADASDGASGPIVIGDDVWIAHGATIAPGVSIGAGSVISAGSAATKDVPPNSLVIGNPARCFGLSVIGGAA